jgi:flagellar motor switch protein FliN/FliY
MDQKEIDRLTGGGAAHPQPTAAAFSELPSSGARASGGSLEALRDVSLPVAIEFGRTNMTVQEVLELGAGSVIQLERMVGEPIDIFVGDRRLAEGEVVVIGEHFGVRITRIIPSAELRQPVA